MVILIVGGFTDAVLVDDVPVGFKFDADYDAVVGEDKEGFINHVKPQICAQMGVDEDRVRNFNIHKGNTETHLETCCLVHLLY